MMNLESSANPQASALSPKREAELHELCNEKPVMPVAVIHVHNLYNSPEVMEQTLQNPANDEKKYNSTVDTTTSTRMEPAPLFMKLRIGFAATGVFVGLSILLFFQADPNLRNLHIALWGLASAFFALMTMIVHIAHLKWNRDKWVHRLKLGILLGFIVQTGCIVAFLTYIILAAVQNQPLYPLDGNEREVTMLQQSGYS
ncbi:uncharacterized protein [Amphiura filiformis]|uniref:uncharacterized protein n=1 Tax=Amphiura filiformis TaxID=82378 RepID=UPI003B210FDA